jgi:hypothetical protein
MDERSSVFMGKVSFASNNEMGLGGTPKGREEYTFSLSAFN